MSVAGIGRVSEILASRHHWNCSASLAQPPCTNKAEKTSRTPLAIRKLTYDSRVRKKQEDKQDIQIQSDNDIMVDGMHMRKAERPFLTFTHKATSG